MKCKNFFAVAFVAAAVLVLGQNAQSQVTFTVETLAPNGSNLTAPAGVPQHSGITAQFDDAVREGGPGNGDGTGQLSEFNAGELISFNGFDFVKSPEQIVLSAGGALFGRNNNPADNGGVGDDTFQFTAAESFGLDGLGLPTITEDAYFDVNDDGEEDDLHSAIEGILFSGPSFTVNNLVEGEEYIVKAISWDAGAENEGPFDRKQTITAFDSMSNVLGSADFMHEVADGPDVFATVGDSSDEILANLITAEFTADASGSIRFNIDPQANVNDNGILNAVLVFGDNSLVPPPIPEPASALLAAMGIAGLGLVRRRK